MDLVRKGFMINPLSRSSLIRSVAKPTSEFVSLQFKGVKMGIFGGLGLVAEHNDNSKHSASAQICSIVMVHHRLDLNYFILQHPVI